MNTVFLLLAEYGTGQIPLDRCAHLFGLSPEEAAKRAGRQALPIPAFRAGTQKSPWLVGASDLANFLDTQRAVAKRDWTRLRDARHDDGR